MKFSQCWPHLSAMFKSVIIYNMDFIWLWHGTCSVVQSVSVYNIYYSEGFLSCFFFFSSKRPYVNIKSWKIGSLENSGRFCTSVGSVISPGVKWTPCGRMETQLILCLGNTKMPFPTHGTLTPTFTILIYSIIQEKESRAKKSQGSRIRMRLLLRLQNLY